MVKHDKNAQFNYKGLLKDLKDNYIIMNNSKYLYSGLK